MRRVLRVALAYDGSAFAGFQRQPDRVTVESVLRSALVPLIPDLGPIHCGGRTDRGVHATGQIISFSTRALVELPPIRDALDQASPALAVLDVREVSRSFHARFSAGLRRYVYLHADAAVDIRCLDRMLIELSGTRCFTAYARDTERGRNSVRTLVEARARRVVEEGHALIRFDFAAPSFLRKQVRVMVSTAIREALAGAADDALVEIARSGDRTATAPPAAPGGLYLVKIGYHARPIAPA